MKSSWPQAVVALSGGKDSTAAVIRLREQGYRVQAMTMRLGIVGEEERLEKIERLTHRLDIPWEIVDLASSFQTQVIDAFIDEYRRGRTPNPCMICNQRLKFGLLMDFALKRDAENRFATGHYASLKKCGQHTFLAEPKERRKSQIYFLSHIDPAASERSLFPIADLTLAEVRERVADLPLASSEESQDACFLSGSDLPTFLCRVLPEAFRPGEILDMEGRVIGTHQGVIHYTIGQRRGTRLAAGRRIYVIRVDVEKQTVTLGDDRELLAASLTARQPVYWREVISGERCKVKVRYRHAGEDAVVEEASPSRFRLRFLRPVRAITPGQYAVIYDQDTIVASGVID